MGKTNLISQESKNLIRERNCFDLIRYYLALIVVFAHFAVLSGCFDFNWITNSGEAVSGFFTLSGFLVFYSFTKRPILKDYASNRLKRILPPYLFIVILCALAGAIISNLTVREYFSSTQLYKYLFSNLCFLNFLEPALPGIFTDNAIQAVNGSLWTMKVELMLYTSVPITYYFFKRYNKAAVLVAIFAISIAYKYALLHMLDTTGNELYRILARQVGTQLIYFYSGTAILFYFEQFQKVQKYILIPTLIIYLLKDYIPFYSFFEPFVFSILIIGIAYNAKFLFVFSKLPNISYGIYLFHFPVIQTIVHFKIHEYSSSLALVLSLAITIALALFSWKFIEKPFMNKRKAIS